MLKAFHNAFKKKMKEALVQKRQGRHSMPTRKNHSSFRVSLSGAGWHNHKYHNSQNQASPKMQNRLGALERESPQGILSAQNPK